MKDVTYLRPTKDEARIAFTPRLAVDYMEQGALAWTGDWKCVACHTNGSYMVVRPLMTERLGPPQKAMRDFFVGTLNEELATDREGFEAGILIRRRRCMWRRGWRSGMRM